ncbi:MAG: hypothetical protein ACR2LA_09615 [Acidimicrobiales bacterium]
MSTHLLSAYVAVRSLALSAQDRLDRLRADERGEGVISAAIAVLVMAFLGAAMWLAFKGMFSKTTDNTRDQVDQIGR